MSHSDHKVGRIAFGPDTSVPAFHIQQPLDLSGLRRLESKTIPGMRWADDPSAPLITDEMREAAARQAAEQRQIEEAKAAEVRAVSDEALRDRFAAEALRVVVMCRMDFSDPEEFAREAYDIADAMMVERAKRAEARVAEAEEAYIAAQSAPVMRHTVSGSDAADDDEV
jgi:hypothetical protein